MYNLVLFEDLSTHDTEYGILLDNNDILCLCCGGIVGKEYCEILERPTTDINISNLLKEELRG